MHMKKLPRLFALAGALAGGVSFSLSPSGAEAATVSDLVPNDLSISLAGAYLAGRSAVRSVR